MTEQHSEDEADTPSVFAYASSVSRCEDVDMTDSDNSALHTQCPSLKQPAESDTDIFAEAMPYKRVRRCSSSSTATTSGRSSSFSGPEHPSAPFSGEMLSGMFPNYYDDCSRQLLNRPTEDDADYPSRPSPRKRVKTDHIGSSTTTPKLRVSPTPVLMPPSIFWRCCMCGDRGYTSLRPRITACYNCEHVKCAECDKKTAEERQKARENCVAPMIHAAGTTPVARTSWATPSQTRYADGDPRCRCNRELTVEDMKRILRRGGSGDCRVD